MADNVTKGVTVQGVPRKLRDMVAQRLGAQFGDSMPNTVFQVRRSKRRLMVSWCGRPTESAVSDVVGALVDACDVPVEVVLTHTPMWSCGQFHTDAADAWIRHRLFRIAYARDAHGLGRSVVSEDSIGELAGGDSELEQALVSLLTDVPTCDCGSETIVGAYEEDIELLVKQVGVSWNECVVGEFERCPICGGEGRVFDSKLNMSVCGWCSSHGTFNMAVPDRVSAFKVAAAEGARLRMLTSSEARAQLRPSP